MGNNAKKNKKLNISAEKVRALHNRNLERAAGGSDGASEVSGAIVSAISLMTRASQEETRCDHPTFNPDYPCLTSDCTDPFSAFCTTY